MAANQVGDAGTRGRNASFRSPSPWTRFLYVHMQPSKDIYSCTSTLSEDYSELSKDRY